MNAAVKAAEPAEKKHETPARAAASAFAPAPAPVLTTPLAWQRGDARLAGDPRVAGNMVVQHLMRAGALQAKLAVGAPGDMYEHEADRVAERVLGGVPAGVLQRKCACGGSGDECEECSAGGATIQRRAVGSSGPSEAPAVVGRVLGSGGGRPLDSTSRSFMESRFGHDFGGVRVHDDARAAESARAVGARAYTLGRDVVFASGQYAPESAEGKRLLAHELTHVVQQSGGGAQVVRRDPGDGSDQVCEEEPPVTTEEENTCAMPTDGQDAGGGSASGPRDFVSYGGLLLSTDPEQVRGQLVDALGLFGKKETLLIIQGLEDTLGTSDCYDPDRSCTTGVAYGVGATEFGRQIIPKIVKVMRDEMAKLEREHEAFKGLVIAGAQVRLERNREALKLWKKFLNEKVSPEQAHGQIVGQITYDLGMKAIHHKNMSAMSWYQQYLTTHYLYIQHTRADMLEGRINGGCQQCHSENFYRDAEMRQTGTLGGQQSVLEVLEQRAQEEADSPTPRPLDKEGKPAGAGMPGWAKPHAEGYPDVQRAWELLDTIRPYLQELGSGGYDVIDASVIDTTQSPVEVVGIVSGQIEKRREDFKQASEKIGAPGFDYLQLVPVLRTLLAAASPVEQAMVAADQQQAEEDAHASMVWDIVGGIAAFLLTIFPPTAPLGMALGAAMALKGIAGGYEDLQQGILLKQAKGADDVFTPEQQQAADQLILGGMVGIVLNAVDLVGVGAEVLPFRKPPAGAASELGVIERIEAKAAGHQIEIRGVDGAEPHVTVTAPDGTVRYEGPINQMEPGLAKGMPDAPGGARPHGEMPSDAGDFLKSTAEKTDNITTTELQREYDITRGKSRSKLPEGGEYVEEVVLENGHTWRKRSDGRWCRFSDDPLCMLLGEGMEAGAVREVSKGRAGLEDPAANRAREELRGNMGPSVSGWQDHHIIPYELRSHPAIDEAAKRGWNINGGNNGVRLPSSTATRGTGTQAIHRGSHPAYTLWVENRLDQILQQWRLGAMPDSQLVPAIDALAAEFGTKLSTGKIRLSTNKPF